MTTQEEIAFNIQTAVKESCILLKHSCQLRDQYAKKYHDLFDDVDLAVYKTFMKLLKWDTHMRVSSQLVFSYCRMTGAVGGARGRTGVCGKTLPGNTAMASAQLASLTKQEHEAFQTILEQCEETMEKSQNMRLIIVHTYLHGTLQSAGP